MFLIWVPDKWMSMLSSGGNAGVDQLVRPAFFQRPIFYASVNAFLCLVPGSVLLLFGGGNRLIIPRSMVELIAPFAILPQEKTIVTALLDWSPRLRIASNGFDLPPFSLQFLILAFLSFFVVMVVLTCQAYAGALYTTSRELGVGALLKGVVVCAGMRVVCISVMATDPASIHPQLPTEHIAFPLMLWVAPGGVILFTCCLAMGLWQLARILFLALRGALLGRFS